MISHDFESTPAHFWNSSAGQENPGVFLMAQDVPVAIAIESIVEIWVASDASEWVNRLAYLPL